MTDGEDSEEDEIEEEEEEEELDEGEYGNDEKETEVCKMNIPLMHRSTIDLTVDAYYSFTNIEIYSFVVPTVR